MAMNGQLDSEGVVSFTSGMEIEEKTTTTNGKVNDMAEVTGDSDCSSTPLSDGSSQRPAITDSSEEDYDAIEVDPLQMTTTESLRKEKSSPALVYAEKEAAGNRVHHRRRKSIPITLEKTEQKGQYLLRADDPELRQFLHSSQHHSPSTGKRRKRFSDLVFTQRFSAFDRQNVESATSPFHGFFTLFWLGTAVLIIKVAALNWKNFGSVFGRNEVLELMFHRDVLVLGLTDGVMCVATIVGLGLQRLILKDYLSWNISGWIIQNVWQTLFLGATLAWAQYREWPWTHNVFIVLHCLVMVMKQHSYAFYNGYLSELYKQRAGLEKKLVDLPSKGSGHSTDESASLRHLVQQEIDELSEELRGKASVEERAYPENLTLGNWAEYIVFPTVVYELEYPRQETINWSYVAEKTAATFGCIGVMIVVSQAFIYPCVIRAVALREVYGLGLQDRLKEFPWILADLVFPFMFEYLLSWYVIWECVLNVLAELTRFADRGFYADWWNSTSWDQFARDWNRPVHNFLLRHVYHSSISAFRVSRTAATFFTFFLSACVHELIMWCIFHKLRGYLMMMQMMQLPLVMASRTKLLRGRRILGNVVFWLGIFTGPSFLCSLYLII